MFDFAALLIAIPGLPLAAAVTTAALGPRVLKGQSHWPTIVALAGSFLASLALLAQVAHETPWEQAKRDAAAHGDAQPRSEHAGEASPVAAGKGAAASGAGKENRVGVERVIRLWTWAAVPSAGAVAPPRGGDSAGVSDGGPSSLADAQGTSHDPAPPSPATPAPSFQIDVALRADPLTAIMLSMVTFISLLVAIYSVGYMHGDDGYWRFFSYVPLFVFSMTMLVSVSNFVLLYVFWEAVGLCSYLLIGFWYQKPEAAAAGKKAFLVNRVGDFGFALGVFLIWLTYGTLDFHDTVLDGRLVSAGVLGQHLLQHPALYVGGPAGVAICLLLMAGACGKSAQFPLHVWLPDAMEGPTPVSALIHAATMVTAGVYMVARCMPLFMVSAVALQVVATIGCITVVLGALIALTQTDLKRVLAYSTISQLGYMFLGLGTGSLLGATAGMFHLFTHAFFKALLFLGAGSVMHAMGGIIDLRRFGGLKRLMPITAWTFLFGSLALAGIFPFAGFFSKDLILLAVKERAREGAAAPLYFGLQIAGTIAAGLTAFYSFRAYFLAFHGVERIPHEAGHHAHESPRAMTVPLVILALCALVVGGYFEYTHGFAEFLRFTPSLAYRGLPAYEHAGWTAEHWQVAIISEIVAFAGLAVAAALYLGGRSRVEALASLMRGIGLYGLSYGKFFFDEIYGLLIVAPLRAAARLAARFDDDAIDGLVNSIGAVPLWFGRLLRPVQNGMLQFYALAMLVGLLVLFGALRW